MLQSLPVPASVSPLRPPLIETHHPFLLLLLHLDIPTVVVRSLLSPAAAAAVASSMRRWSKASAPFPVVSVVMGDDCEGGRVEF